MNDKKTASEISGQPGQIEFKKILFRYLKYWYLFVTGVIICTAIAFVYLRYATPQYSISSTLLIKDADKGSDIKSNNALFKDFNIFSLPTNLDNEIEVLKSKGLMNRVLTELNLNTTYFVKGKIRNKEIYGRDLPMKLIINHLDSSAFKKTITLKFIGENSFMLDDEDEEPSTLYKFGQKIKKYYGTFMVVPGTGLSTDYGKKPLLVKFNDIRKIADDYSDKIKIDKVNKMAMVITIGLTDAVPEKGKDIINKLIEVYTKEAIEDKNVLAANTLEFVDDRLKYLTNELADVEKGVEDLKKKNQIADVTSQAQVYIEEASDNDQQLNEWNIQIDVLESLEKYLQNKENEFGKVPSALGIKDPTFTGLITSFNELQLERERMLRTAQPSNPIVQSINGQLSNLRMNILENLRNIKNGLIITRNKLQNTSGQFQSKIQKVPSIERELLEINRQQSIKQALYLYLLQKREESALSLASSVSNCRIIDPATAEDDPVSPKALVVYFAALILGLGAPFTFIYLKELLNDTVLEIKEVELATSAPILGEIIHNNDTQTLIVKEKTRSPIAEIFHLIRLNLLFAMAGKENKVILVTSSMSGEGKTFFCINLGASLAITGKKVVVLGFDLRKPSLLKNLDLPYKDGITNYLISNSESIYDTLTPTSIMKNLYIIGAGTIPPNPAEMMIHPKVEDLINELKETFDHIIIDTAPVGQVADAYTLNSYADSTIYMVRYNYTYKTQLEIVNNIYLHKKLKQPMIVLNDARKENGYKYGYGYGYEDGNTNSSEKKKRRKSKSLI